MNVLHIRLTPDTLVRRSFEFRDTVEVETPDTHLIINIDPSSAYVAAEAGASLLASARRQSMDELHSEDSPQKGSTMRKMLALVVAVLGLAVSASAQDAAFFATLTPGTSVEGRPGCAWQWARDTIGPWGGWYHACNTPAPPDAPTPAPAADPCVPRPDPYTPEGAILMQRCIASRGDTLPPLQPTVFRVGGRYYQPYPLYNMVAVSVALGIDGREIVTAQWLKTGDTHRAGEPFIVFDEDRYKWLPVTEAPIQVTAR